MDSKTIAEEQGLIAIKSSGGDVKFHLLRRPGGKTVCGRYWGSRHTGTERVTENTPTCQVCTGTHNDERVARRAAELARA